MNREKLNEIEKEVETNINNLLEMKTVKAKQTLQTASGRKEAGETFDIQNSFADDMKERGLVDIVGDAEEKKAEKEETKEKFNVTDNTTKGEKKQILKPGTTKK